MRDQKEINKEMYDKRRAEKLCLWCGKPLDRDGVLCQACAEKSRTRYRLNREYYLKMGVCPYCRKRKVTPGRKSCLPCRENAAMKHGSRSHPDLAKQKSIYRKSKRIERLEKGLCTVCGKREAEPGFKTCADCRRRQKKYRHIFVSKYQLSDRSLWVSQGRCERCGSYDLQEGTKLCKEHYKQVCEALEKGREVSLGNKAAARAAQEAAELQKSHELRIQYKPRTMADRKQLKEQRERQKDE